jgi:hypothetical protein
MFDPELCPDFESTPYTEVIQFARAVAVVNGDYDHPIQEHLDTLERQIASFESSYRSAAYFK